MKVLPIIAAANSAFGKSVTDKYHMLFFGLVFCHFECIGEIFDCQNFGRIRLEIERHPLKDRH